MNSGAQCPGFKSQLRQLPSQAWWFSLRATATHAGPPERGGQTCWDIASVPGHPVHLPEPRGCREVVRTLTRGPSTPYPVPRPWTLQAGEEATGAVSKGRVCFAHVWRLTMCSLGGACCLKLTEFWATWGQKVSD